MSYQVEDNKNNVDILEVLSNEEDTKGFDIEAGKSWHYPTNYPLRDYQYNIVQQSLYKNTLVSLPTGLGKTFIAAVVMYNFYRWYPSGKIVFMAPTRPLVKQQVDACYNIMAIPKDVTVEITGSKVKASRKILWDQKRVFFITPQILQNDLEIIENLSGKIKCLVFDEAHRAKGNHAYCEVIRKLYPKNKYFRVLALSATPGSSVKDVYEVINNLLIAHLEVRTEESLDVAPYVFHRSLQTVIVPLGGKLEEIKSAYMKVLERYTRVLVQNKIISGNCNQLTKGKIFMTMKNYQEKNKANGGEMFYEIMRTLNICVTLYHAYELLIRHGLRGFLSFYEDHIDKPLLRGIQEIREILQDIQSYLGPVPNVDPLPDGSVPDVPDTITFGHPKYYELGKILANHFSIPENTNSRVIIFCEYKESVMEAYTLLLKNRPLIKPKYFMGQGAMPQRIQMSVINSFREGECNTLISTCIGEEGLDVGEVDLIVCFDINNKSPIRLVQRIGRTGRKRQGKVIVLVTEGKEQQILKECLAEKQNLSSRIITSKELHNGLFKNNPRMVPENINPSCEKLHMTVTQSSSSDKKQKTGSNVEVIDEHSNSSKKDSGKEKPKPSRKRVSKEDKNLSQNSSGGTKNKKAPKKSKLAKSNLADNFKQCDLKSMFSKELKRNAITVIPKGSCDDIIEKTDISSVPSPPTINNTLVEDLFSEISAFVTINDVHHSCKVCNNLFECSKLDKSVVQFDCDFDLENWTNMDENAMKSINSDAFDAFASSLDLKEYNVYNDFDMPDCVNFAPDRSWNNISFRNSFICDNSNKKSVAYGESITKISESPTNNHLNQCDRNNIFTTLMRKQQTMSNKKTSSGAKKSLLENFKINQAENCLQKKNKQKIIDLDDFLDDTFKESLINLTRIQEQNHLEKKEGLNKTKSSLQSINANREDDFGFTNIKDTKSKKSNSKKVDVTSPIYKNALEFFHLHKIEDIFEPLNDSQTKGRLQISQNSPNSSEETVIYDLNDVLHSRESSPVLTGRVQSYKLRTQEKLSQKSRSQYSTENSKLCETDFDSINLSNELLVAEHKQPPVPNLFIMQNKSGNLKKDFYNSGSFEFQNNFSICKTPNNKKSSKTDALNKNSSGSSSEFETDKKNTKTEIKLKENSEVVAENKIEDVSILHDLDNFCDISVFGLSNIIKTNEITPLKNKINSQLQRGKNHKNLPNTSQKENFDINERSPIISQFDKTENLPSQMSITQGIEYINKSKCKSVTSLLKKLKSDDFSDDFCFMERRNKQPSVTPKKENCAKFQNSNKSPHVSHADSKKSPKINFMKGIRKIDSDSDDDFEQSPLKPNTGWLPRKIGQTTSIQNPSFTDAGKQNKIKSKTTEQNNFKFIEPSLPKQNAKKKIEKNQRSKSDKTRRKREKVKNKPHDFSFFEKEAQLDSEEEVSSDTTEGSDDDIFEMSFVNDETQDMGNNTMMHAEYLKSVRSPTLNRGQFKIPENPPLCLDVFSQVPNTQDNSYLNDSFCDDNIHYLTQKEEMSVLELAEMQLEEKRKNRKRKKSKEQPEKIKKRRVIVISSDESE